MIFVVPFDGSELAETAVVRATEFSDAIGERVIAVTVIPTGNAEYARDHDWIAATEPFDMATIVASLHERVTTIAPEADFRHETVGTYTTPGTIATRLRTIATDEAASMVFIGSENAGRIVTGITSVGATVAAEDAYDVVIIRTRSPPTVETLTETDQHRHRKSDFYT